MRDTDATGALYFTAQLSFAVEAFEEMLRQGNLPLAKLLKEGEYALPVVHAETDYLTPLHVGDGVEVQLTVSDIGNTSFTIACDFVKVDSDTVVGTASTTHVVVNKETEKGMPIPPALLTLLQNC